jgi:hypothetical protein
MMTSKVRLRYEEWQTAVSRHEEEVRNARRHDLSPRQSREMAQKALFVVDTAFARYKEAQAEPDHESDDLPDASVRDSARRNISASAGGIR